MNIARKIWFKIFPLCQTNDRHMRIMEDAIRRIEEQRKNKIIKNEKINVIFVCHRPQLWNSLASIYEAMMKDSRFNVTIVAIPNKKELPVIGLLHEKYESEGAEDFFKDFSCTVINGYNYKERKWANLKNLNPDYVFFQTPYDALLPEKYQSYQVSLYTKMCYVHYGMPFMDGFILEESTPKNFLINQYFHFAEFEEMKLYYQNRVIETPIHKREHVIVTGYPKFDNAKKYFGVESVSWKNPKGKLYRVMWTPRWNIEENNCTFFDYKDALVDYACNNEMELLFRPHPQAFLEYVAKGLMSNEEVREYKQQFERNNNLSLDTQKEYLPSFYSTDVLISDESSIIPEYFYTGKPIIFTYKETHLNSFAKELSKGFYWAKDMEEISEILQMLKNGDDPKREKRQSIIKNSFALTDKPVGETIKDIIKEDFYR